MNTDLKNVIFHVQVNVIKTCSTISKNDTLKTYVGTKKKIFKLKKKKKEK